MGECVILQGPVWSVPTISSVQSLSCVQIFVTPWTAARQASLSITNSQSLLKLMSTESVMPSNHLILCHPLLLPPSIFPNIRVFSDESDPGIRWPKCWSFSFSISPSSDYSRLISFRIDWLDLFAVQGTLNSMLIIGSIITVFKPEGIHCFWKKREKSERRREILVLFSTVKPADHSQNKC